MSNQGPVCHVPSVNQPATPQTHDLPGLGGPPQPTIQSLMRAVIDLQRVVRSLSGQQQTTRPSSDKTGSNGFKTKEDKKKEERWTEEARVVEKVRVFQNNDKTSDNWVDVEQINQLKMRDKVTGERWAWDRERK
jgi:hypothetical protein